MAAEQGENGCWPVDEAGRAGSPATYGRPLATLVAAHRQAERSGTQLLLRTEPSQIRDVLAAFEIPPDEAR